MALLNEYSLKQKTPLLLTAVFLPKQAFNRPQRIPRSITILLVYSATELALQAACAPKDRKSIVTLPPLVISA